MKKYFYSLFATATMLLVTTSCSQEEDFVQQSSSEMTTFSVSMNGLAGSRALVGDGTTATKLYYEVYRGDECIIDKNQAINTTTTVEMNLLKGETYDIIFWAQAANGAIYQIDDLRNITIDYNAGQSANKEEYDAFYNALNGFKADGKTHTIELRRPFAQLNLGTDDWAKAMEGLTQAEQAAGPVTHTSVTVTGLADTFNPLTGLASASTQNITAEFALNTIPAQEKLLANNKEYKYLSLNYLLVPNSKAPQGEEDYQPESSDEKANVDLVFALNRGEKELFTIDVPNAPVQRNWRTNVVGSLLTGSKFEVIIEEGFDGEYNNIDLLKEVLTKGGELTLTSDLTLTEPISIPEGVEAKINLNEKTLTVASANTVEGSLSISNGDIKIAVEGDEDLEIGFYAKDGSVVEFKDTKINVDENSVAVFAEQNGTVTVNMIDSEMTVAGNGHGISMMFGSEKQADVNIKRSTLTGTYAFYLCAVNANVLIDEESSVENFWVGSSSTVTVTYAGEKPVIKEDGTANTITYVQMGITTYEGIYQVENKKEYNVTSAEGVLNLHKLMADISTGEGQGATINLTTDIDLKNEPFTPIDKMWVTFNGNGHTIKNLYVPKTWKAGFFGYLGGGSINDLTIENANVTGAQVGIFAGAVEGTINNCFLKGTNTVTWVACHQYNDPASSLEAWNGIGAITGILQPSTINAVIEAGTTVTLNKTGFTTADGCKYIDNLTGYIGANKGTVTNNGTVTSVVNVSDETELETAISNAWQMGKVTIVMAEGTYSNDITFIAPANYTQSDDLVFKAAEGANVIYTGTIQLGLYEYGTLNVKKWEADITFERITFDHAENEKHSLEVQNMGVLSLNNCKIIGNGEFGINSSNNNSSGNNSKFYKCEFVNMGAQIKGQFGNGLTFDECTFNDSRVNVQGGVGVTIQNSTFTNTLTSANINDSFYLIRSNAIPITVKGVTINIDSELADVATAQTKWGILWNRGTTNWSVENTTVTITEAAMKQTELLVTKCTSTGVINTTNLTVNGKKYIAEGVLKNNEGEFEIYKAAGLSYFSGKKIEGTINLLADIDMKNEIFKTMLVTYSKELTFNGNNKTIKNIKLVDAGHNGNVGCTSLFQTDDNASLSVNNLKVSDVTIEAGATRSAVICAYNNAVLTLKNVDVTKANLTGIKNSAVLVGYTVKPINIEGCDVTESSVTTTGTSSSTNSLYPAAAFVSRVNTSSAVVTIKNSTNTTSLPAIGEIMGGGSVTIDGENVNM